MKCLKLHYGPGLLDLFRVTFQGPAFFDMAFPPGYIISEDSPLTFDPHSGMSVFVTYIDLVKIIFHLVSKS